MSDGPDITRQLRRELDETRLRLAEAEETLEAIRHGEADGFVIAGPQGPQVFTLQGAQEPYRLLIEQMSEGALTLAPDGVILYANQTFAAMLQLPPGRVIGAALRDFLPAPDQPALAGLIATALDGSSAGEVSLRAAAGATVTLRLGLHRLQVGAEILICAVATDISMDKQREIELCRVAERLEARVAERTADLAASRIAALNMMEEAVEGRKAVEEANRGLTLEITARQQAEAEIRTLNTELERRVRERTAELHDTNQKLTVVNQELTVVNQELTVVKNELEAFCYSVSHDLRTPLRAIDGFSRIVQEDNASQLDAASLENLERVRAASQRMSRLIDDLLQLSRLTRHELQRAPLDLSALARTVADALQATVPERRVDWVIAPGLQAEADANLIQSVLENLLGNAWKFTGKEPAARIEFGAGAAGEPKSGLKPGPRPPAAPVFFVRDNGAGFDMTYAGKLFGAFQRLHAATEFPGTGVGLASVQRVIHRHHGRVWAESAVGRGTTFYFTLPNQKKQNYE